MTQSAVSHCLLLWSASDTLACGMYRLGTGISSCFGRLRLLPSSSVTQSATCKFGLQGPLTFMRTRALPRLHRSCNRHWQNQSGVWLNHATRWRHDHIGSLKRGPAAQLQRFWHCSIPGDAGSPSALDALPWLASKSGDWLSDNVAMTVACVQVGLSVAIDCLTCPYMVTHYMKLHASRKNQFLKDFSLKNPLVKSSSLSNLNFKF